jgi:hypothetical protein
MPLKDRETGESLEAIIERVIESDYRRIKSSKEFDFDWKLEKKNEVYKIYLLDQKKDILGLMSLIDYPEEYRIHLNLIELGNKNKGKSKTIDNIAGCLLAFACDISFVKGYYGFVSLQPKSKLIDLYQDKYGFRQYGRLLAVEQASAQALINKYLSDEK